MRTTQLARYIAGMADYDRAECWRWPHYKNAQGYGLARIHGVTTTAHRAVWLATGRTIPDGWVLDHVCCNPICVNPHHMEPCTNGENLRRGYARMQPMEHNLTTVQVAEIIGVSGRTVYRWALRGDLPYVRNARGASRFKRSDVDAFIAEHKKVSA